MNRHHGKRKQSVDVILAAIVGIILGFLLALSFRNHEPTASVKEGDAHKIVQKTTSPVTIDQELVRRVLDVERQFSSVTINSFIHKSEFSPHR